MLTGPREKIRAQLELMIALWFLALSTREFQLKIFLESNELLNYSGKTRLSIPILNVEIKSVSLLKLWPKLQMAKRLFAVSRDFWQKKCSMKYFFQFYFSEELSVQIRVLLWWIRTISGDRRICACHQFPAWIQAEVVPEDLLNPDWWNEEMTIKMKTARTWNWNR